MSWVKVATTFPRHPKALLAGPPARHLYLCSLMWSGEYGTEGLIPTYALETLAHDAGIVPSEAGQYADRLVKAELWKFVADGWVICDWDSWPESACTPPRVTNVRERKSIASVRRETVPLLSTVMGPAGLHKCSYCSAPAEAWDHVMPRSRGGPDTAENLVPACRSCNSQKSARTPEEWWESRYGDEPLPEQYPRAFEDVF
jgi:hypothetical protein